MIFFRNKAENERVKIVYVLVSSRNDCYYEQFLLSLYSLRYSNPDRVVEVVTDRDTREYLIEKKEPLLSDVSFHVVQVEGSGMYKSRFLKTSLREQVSGDFLFLDVDTLVCGSLAPVDKVKADVAAVISLNGQGRILNERKRRYLSEAGFGDYRYGPYFNSGVMLVRDTAAAHRLFNAWHKGWQQSFLNGVPFDQPALYVADRGEGFMIKPLSPVWNCVVPIDGGIHFFKRARIIHWISSKGFFTESVIAPHIKHAPDGHPDEIALSIARTPHADMGLFRADGKPSWRLKLYSDLLSLLRRLPRAYLFAVKLRKHISAR